MVVLGGTGHKCRTHMTGGTAFVLDSEDGFERRYNPKIVRIERVSHNIDSNLLRELIERHTHLTLSPHGSNILLRWDQMLGKFWKVVPQSDTLLETASERDMELLAHAAL